MLNTGSNIIKKDYLIGALIGFFTGILALKIFSFLSLDFKFQKEFLLLGIPVLWVAGVWLGGFLGKWLPFFNQFGKFAVVGFLGAAIDFSILNWVSHFTGITAGFTLGWINIPGFLVAVINNYFWNKLWVFSVKGGPASGGKISVWGIFPKFLAVTIIGLAINSGTIIALTSISFGFDGQIWLNISKVVANAIALIWNFIGYKFFAFKKNV